MSLLPLHSSFKGAIADDALESAFKTWAQTATHGSTFCAVELGSHCGYSSVRFASKLKTLLLESKASSFKARLICVDPDPLGAAISAKMLWHAGLTELVEPELAYSGDYFKRVAQQQPQQRQTKIDFLFIDHVKELYLADVQLALQLNLLRPGSVVVADNVVCPGAPDYKEWILNGEGKKKFDTRVHETFVEYSTRIRDQVLVSRML